MAKSSALHNVSHLVGVRPQAEVELAHHALNAVALSPQTQTQYSNGALTGYLWALGRGTAAPVTGARSGGTPTLAGLTEEIDATVVQLAAQTQRTVPRDFLQGVHDALAWVCGYSDDRPCENLVAGN
ncbi:hypothetical protein EDD99_6115 [Streptomyces sp. 846.5]|nr:hypothetical protein EDD99_6115 [Streptomyces sp. 846.5]